MTKTQNYQLPQWVKEDRIMMDDFNEMCANIEKGITGAKSAADAAQSAAAAAQSAADAAQSAANSAFKPGQLPWVTGSYASTSGSKTITLGFRPSFVIISGMFYATSTDTGRQTQVIALTGGNVLGDIVTFTDTGFIVSKKDSRYPDLLSSSMQYDYIAFR